MYTPTGADSGEDAPSVRKPSQYYVDGYLARQGTSGAPPQTPLPPSAASPRSTQRRTAKIFYELEKECPKHYYPKLHVVDPGVMRCIRYMLLVLCVVQTLAAVSIGSMATARGMLHDDVNKQFTVGALMLCAFAGVCGLVGVWGKSRGLLLFFYINELWGLSNVCTFFVMALQSDERTGASCEMLRTGEMSAEVLASAGVTPAVCDERASRRASLVAAMILLMSELWVSCFLAKTYSEYIQDEANDEDDRQLVDFIWDRRRETWLHLRRFEDVVQRQFEELRASLHSRTGMGGSKAQLMVGGQVVAQETDLLMSGKRR